MYANTGRIIRIDLSSGKTTTEQLPEEYYHNFIGGSGLAARYFWDHGDMEAEALSPEALLLFMNGPFAGLRLSGASRSCVAARSPLTGNWGDSSSGGYFAPTLRYAGYDGIVITGRATSPVMLCITDETVEIVDAGHLWGLPVSQTDRTIKDERGRFCRTLVIGPAGENGVRYANIMGEAHHAFGRAGFGTVMGSKNLKAIAVSAETSKMTLADSETYSVLRKTLNDQIRESITGMVLGELGTAAKLEYGVCNGDVPIRNWTSSFWEEMGEALTGDALSETFLTGRRSCAFCSIACKRVVRVADGPFAVDNGPGPEYETIVSFGALLGSMDLAATCKAGRVCNEAGMDTISAGATLAWATEAMEKGALSPQDCDGIQLTWGNMPTYIEVLPQIASRNGELGRLLAEGSVAAAGKIGKGSVAYTAHSKGLEAPMHDPRGGGHGLALAYAVSPRGGCHVAACMLPMEAGACYYPEIDFDYELEPMTDQDKPYAAVIASELGQIENSACYCQFADREITLTQWVDLFNCVAGYNWDIQKMLRAGRRIFYLKRLLNYRFGCRGKDDTLPPRMLEPARDGEPEGIEINFEGMKAAFYELMGFDNQKGIPVKSVLAEYGLQAEADLVWPAGKT